jgi:hypothetical protein
MHFSTSDSSTADTAAFDPSNYNVTNASGIYRLSAGKYAVVLTAPGQTSAGVFNLSGTPGFYPEISNTVSTTGDYIDVWTVQRVADTDLDTIINQFTLSEDRFFGVTEPLLFTVNTRLENNHVVLGSKVDIKLTNEFTLENSNIDRSILNLFKDSLVLNPMLEIVKKNGDRNLPARVTVSGYSDTSGYTDVTANNTVIFTFDTEELKTHGELTNGNLGSLTGTYAVRLKFTALNQTIVSDDMAFIIR